MAGIEQNINLGEEVPLSYPPAGAINTTTDETQTPTGEGGRGSLKGSPPKEFDGTRSKSETFGDDFSIYQRINRKNQVMKEPYSRVLMAMSFMKGPKVQDWVRAQMRALDDKVDPRKRGLSEGDETLWDEFNRDFVNSFTDTAMTQEAYNKLKTLKMIGDDLDTYIATHESLVLRAGWAENGDAAIESFRNGLKKPLHLSVLKRDVIPTTLQDWHEMSRREHAKWALIKASDLVGGQSGKQSFQKKWKQQWTRKGETKDPNAMDVDTVQLKPLSNEERQNLSREGRCFRCRQKGHMSRNCPQGGQKQTFTPRTNARTTEVVDDRDDVSETGTEASTSTTRTKDNNAQLEPEMMIRALENMAPEKKEEFFDKMMQKDF